MLALVALLGAGWFAPVKKKIRSLLLPLSQSIYSVDLGLRASQADPLPLKIMITAARIDALEEENETLRAALNFIVAKKYHSVGAEIVGSGADPLRETLILNRGKGNGIEVGYPVIARDGILIGKIIRVDDDVAVAALLSDHQSKVAASAQNSDRSSGLIEGGYGVSVRMNFIPQNENIHVGDAIITSGLEAHIPHGLLIGKVEVVEKETYQPFQRAIIAPALDGRRERLVSVLIL